MRTAAVASVLALLAAGCGGGSGSGDPPTELVGTYATTLQPGDIPKNAAPELEPGSWKLVIATTGAPDDGPFLAIDHPTKGNLEAPGLKVDGDKLTLVQEECGAGGTTNFYDNEYGWRLSGSTLTFTTVKNQCTDKVAETLLTSRPWTKTS